jgi:hypothetical protein
MPPPVVVTLTVTDAFAPTESANVTVVFPAFTAVIVKVPRPLAGETVATAGFADVALKTPAYPASVTLTLAV